MRQILLIGVVIALLVVGAVFIPATANYESEHIEQKEVEEVITEPEYPAEWLEEAEAAKEAVINRRKLEAERDELIESRDEVQSRINEIEKELGVY